LVDCKIKINSNVSSLSNSKLSLSPEDENVTFEEYMYDMRSLGLGNRIEPKYGHPNFCEVYSEGAHWDDAADTPEDDNNINI
jgi:hypothetical protein